MPSELADALERVKRALEAVDPEGAAELRWRLFLAAHPELEQPSERDTD